MLSPAHRRILQALLQAPNDWWPLVRIAKQVGFAHPTVLAHLGNLQAAGLVETRHHGDWGRGSRYRPSFATQHVWLDPKRAVLADWISTGEIDWRFPLVSRVPDSGAQSFLYEWLDRAQARGLLPPFRSKHEPQRPVPHGLQVVVYGSCARGDSSPKSDIDIMVLTDLPVKRRGMLIDLAHEVALTGNRSPDIRALTAADWEAATKALREAIRREGKTVFSSDPALAPIESPTGFPHV